MKKILLTLAIPVLSMAQNTQFSTAKINDVIVYLNSAQMKQTASANVKKGTSEVVIRNVSDQINESTIIVGAPKDVTILSVQYTNNYIEEYDKDDKESPVAKVKNELESITNQLLGVQNKKESINQGIAFLDRGQFTNMNAADVSKMLDVYQNRRTELKNSLIALDKQEKELIKKQESVRTSLEASTPDGEKISRGKIILRVASNKDGNVPFDLSYLSYGASWNPSYDLKAEAVSKPVLMAYKGEIRQTTGIDWKGVNLTLSSGMPSMNNNKPELAPWYLMEQQRREVAYGILANSAPAMKMKESDFAYDESAGVGAVVNENQVNTTFTVPMKYDVASNGKDHAVTLKTINIPATYKYYTVPRMDESAYLMAEVKDYAQYSLLSGKANIIFDGMFVGSSYIDASNTEDILKLSMSRDTRISVKRERTNTQQAKSSGANKEEVFTYAITVKNNKSEKVSINVQDQYPLSSDSVIKSELEKSTGAIVDNEKGFVTWNIDLAPGESKVLEFTYKVKYPKNKKISNLH